jgi:hypothetical protein
MRNRFWKLSLLMVVVSLAMVSQVGAVSSEWKPDGVISENEYDKVQKIGEIEISTRIVGDEIMMAWKAKTTGYIAVGIDPKQVMKGADMIFGYVKDGQVYAEDTYCTGIFGPHPADIVQGGTMDIQMVGGSEKDGVTVIELKRKLDTGDKTDKPLKPGKNKVIWAISNNDDITKKHNKRGSGTLEL